MWVCRFLPTSGAVVAPSVSASSPTRCEHVAAIGSLHWVEPFCHFLTVMHRGPLKQPGKIALSLVICYFQVLTTGSRNVKQWASWTPSGRKFQGGEKYEKHLGMGLVCCAGEIPGCQWGRTGVGMGEGGRNWDQVGLTLENWTKMIISFVLSRFFHM